MIISKKYLESCFCNAEWRGVFMKECSKPIIPIIIDESEPPTLIAEKMYYRVKKNMEDYNDMIRKLKYSLAEL